MRLLVAAVAIGTALTLPAGAYQQFRWPWQPPVRHYHHRTPNAAPAAPDCAEINAWVKSHSHARYETAFKMATAEQKQIIMACEVQP